jgi:hypothetical protein
MLAYQKVFGLKKQLFMKAVECGLIVRGMTRREEGESDRYALVDRSIY